MQTKRLEDHDAVSATGQFHWDTYTLWQQQTRHLGPQVKDDQGTHPGWDPYDVWLSRVKKG